MRLINIKYITKDMILGKDIYKNNQKLLACGCTNINKYINKLSELGINYIYIEDDLSKNIKIEEVITQETKNASQNIIKQVIEGLAFNQQPKLNLIKTSVSLMLDEILSNKNILVNLTDIKNNDDYTFAYSVNVAVISMVIGKLLEYNKDQLTNLGIGALLHDIGKAFIPVEILNKPGKLTDEEFNIMKQHTILGYEAVKDNIELSAYSKISILLHHEKIDGTGYPLKKKGEEIHECAKIITIADVFDALTSDRIYRPKWSIYEALDYLTSLAGSQFDKKLVNIFVQNIVVFPNGTVVRLNTGDLGIVIGQNKNSPTCPLVRIFQDKNKKCIDIVIDLLTEKSITISESNIQI